MTTRPAPALRAHMLKACGEAHAESLASFMALSVSVCRTKGGNSGAGKRGRGTGWRHRQGGIVVRAVNGGGSDAVVIPNVRILILPPASV